MVWPEACLHSALLTLQNEPPNNGSYTVILPSEQNSIFLPVTKNSNENDDTLGKHGLWRNDTLFENTLSWNASLIARGLLSLIRDSGISVGNFYMSQNVKNFLQKKYVAECGIPKFLKYYLAPIFL